MKRLLMACLLVSLSDCGGSDKPAFYQPPGEGLDSGTGGGTSADSGSKGGDKDKDAAPGEDSGPELKFTLIATAEDPEPGTVVTSPMITVHCQAKKRTGSNNDVDESSVAITLEKLPDDPSKDQPATTRVTGTDEYEAKFDASNRPNGAMTFKCVGKDLATKPNTSERSLSVLLDLGPSIEFMEPQDKGVYARKSPVSVKFKVTPQPIRDGDDEAGVKHVSLQVSGMEVPVTETEGSPGLYQTSVNFGDKVLFTVPPTASELAVSATNGRTPTAATRALKHDIDIDGDGPVITVNSPAALSIVHGEVTIDMTIVDKAGVERESVRAEIGSMTISQWDVQGTRYTQRFDTRNFPSTQTQLSIRITASDVVGNERTDTHFLRLDNRPPLLSMDPPNIREWRFVDPHHYCSEQFDPLGDATDDTETVDIASRYRVLVQDQTNVAPDKNGQNAGYYAGVAKDKVRIYAQPKTNVPLLIDTDGNGVCDEINFEALPQDQRPKPQQLSPLEPRGNSWFSKTVDFSESGSDVTNWSASHGWSCEADQNGPEPADAPKASSLCPKSDMIRVVAGEGEDHPPAVYALNPTNGTMGECEGGFWELYNDLANYEGWVCLAARAEDTIGNIGISAPIRVCIDNSLNGTSPCQGAAPTCVGNCTISDSQKFPPNYVWFRP